MGIKMLTPTLLILLASTAVFAQELKGQYKATADIDPWNGARFNKGCVTPGDSSSQSITGVDTTLKAGMKMWELNEGISPKPYKNMTETIVNSVTPVSYDLTLTSHGLDGQSADFSVGQSCQLKTAGTNDKVNFYGRTYTPKEGSQYFDCSWNPSSNMPKMQRECSANLFASGKTAESSSTVGTFTFFKGGKSVTAYRRREVMKEVKINCHIGFFEEATDDGLGEVVRDTIVTNETPTQEALHCGGKSIFIHEKVTNSKGVVLYDDLYEVLGYQ